MQTDLCVVGAGVAGITLAREFLGRPENVIVLEGGGLEFTKSLRALPTVLRRHLFGEQALARGRNEGQPYYPLRFTRVRAFGGSSRAWAKHGLQARPLDAIDFEGRDGFPRHGWPFGRAELDPYYQRAQTICGLGPFAYDVESWETPEFGVPLPVDTALVRSEMFQFGLQSSFDRYKDDFVQAANVNLVLHATAVHIAAKDGTVHQVACATPSGERFIVRTKSLVLAAGAIENARLLLVSRDDNPAGVGNARDLVGRFFMEHFDAEAGFLIPDPKVSPDQFSLYQSQHASPRFNIQAMLRLADGVLRQKRLLNAVVRLKPAYPTGMERAVQSARAIRRSLHFGVPTPGLARHAMRALGGARDVLAHQRVKMSPRAPSVFQLDIMAEQAPNPRSRVRLGTRRDRLGIPVTILDWRLEEADWRSARGTIEILGECLQKAGLGTVVSALEDASPPPAVFGNWHHLGTTRMHRDPAEGVVDENCKVHGTVNLYVAGGSVFPTGGYANPTLTIVALALRLGDHLKAASMR